MNKMREWLADAATVSDAAGCATGGVDAKGGYEPARAAAADIDMDAAAQPPSLAPVLSAVVIASFGALAFGFHLGVVNGPLEAIAADLGFAGNAGLQGTVRPVHVPCPGAPGAQVCPPWLPVQQRSCTAPGRGRPTLLRAGCWAGPQWSSDTFGRLLK